MFQEEIDLHLSFEDLPLPSTSPGSRSDLWFRNTEEIDTKEDILGQQATLWASLSLPAFTRIAFHRFESFN